jgi:hypothetical protein
LAARDEPKIRITGTPNPNAAKFVVERAIFDEEGRSYFEPPSPGEDRLAERIFQVRGVRALFLAEDFVTVTKEEDVGWPDIIDELRETILEELTSAE